MVLLELALIRDLKLGNIVLDKRNQSVTITNFCLGKHLMNDKVILGSILASSDTVESKGRQMKQS
jgi:hypothetical protein